MLMEQYVPTFDVHDDHEAWVVRRLAQAAEREVVERTEWPQAVMQTLQAGILYVAFVFGAGFVRGPIRIVWVVPHVGTRMAELMEMPIMLGVIIVAARPARTSA